MPPDEGKNGGVTVPDYLVKWGLALLQAVVMTALGATITWAWNAEARIAKLESDKVNITSRLASAETELKTVQQNHTQIEILKTELGYIKSGISDIKTLLATPR